ncbi:MAG TPA: site-specific integrase [Azospirillum sp.]|nr:site-specific integrase [Azospirillum sp.]
MASIYKRGRFYWVKFQINGKRVQQSAKTASKAEALKFLAKLQEEFRKLDPNGNPRHTVREAMERFMIEHVPTLKPTTAAGYRYTVRLLHPHFAALFLDEVNRARLAEYVSARKRERVKPATIRRNLACLSSILSQAVNWDWLPYNPVRAFDKRTVRESKARIRYLTPEEYERLLKAAADYLRPMITLAVHTGMRADELLSLEWRQVNLRRREITLEKTKTDLPRVIPLNDTAMGLLTSLPRHLVSPYVFHKADGDRYGRIVAGFRNAVQRARIKDFRFHDLRHTYASWAVQNGMDLYRLSRILGHTTMAMTARYAHLQTDDLHVAVRQVAQRMATKAQDSAPPG